MLNKVKDIISILLGVILGLCLITALLAGAVYQEQVKQEVVVGVTE